MYFGVFYVISVECKSCIRFELELFRSFWSELFINYKFKTKSVCYLINLLVIIIMLYLLLIGPDNRNSGQNTVLVE